MRVLAAICLLSALTCPAPGQPGKPVGDHAIEGKVWGALVHATPAAPAAAKAEARAQVIQDLEERLAKVFPENGRFEIIGEHLQDVFREYESWVVPSKDIFLKVDSKGPAPGGGINLHLQFWRDQQVLVKTDTILKPGSPLFIGGPKWREGRLIFVLVLQE